jgi:hypothetical protein
VRRVVLEFHDFMRSGCRDRAVSALSRYGFDDIRINTEPPYSRSLGIIQAARAASD